MLFDLRGRGRRRTIQVIYLFLAVIMAVGLIGFGIGGATNGGWIDSLFGGGGSSSSSNDVFQQRVDENQKKLQARPNDQAVLVAMISARYQLAQELAAQASNEAASGDNGKANELARQSNAQLALAARTWSRYLKLNPAKVDDSAARAAVNIFAALSKPDQAVAAQEYVIDASGDAATYQQYATLFQFAYQAGQTRKADLAYDKALELAPSKESRAQIKATMDGIKQQANGTSTTPSDAAPPARSRTAARGRLNCPAVPGR